MKKMKWLPVIFTILFAVLIASVQAAEYPVKDINGIITWGAGGSTDNISRAVTPYVEKYLGKQIILTNKPGSGGALGLQWVHNQPSDGYTLLYAAENPTQYRVLEISQLEYKDFTTIALMARNPCVVVCDVKRPWKNMNDLFADAKKHPGELKMGSAGIGSIADVTSAMFKTLSGVEFNQVPFSGDGPAITAILGGHIDWTTAGLASAREHIRAGKVRAIGVISDEPVTGLEDVPLLTAVSKDYKKFLPWGPFYGVFVKKDAPEPVKNKLIDAFAKGLKEPKAQEFIKNFGSIYMGISGAEAEKFLKHFQSVTTWLLYDSGKAKISPEKFGIPRP